LEGTSIERMVASTPEPLVSTALEWPVPVTLLLDWLRALPGTATADNAPENLLMQMAADGSLKRIQHQGWTVDYTRYDLVADSSSDVAEEVLMPTRLEASSGKFRIRTLISEWTL
jgi:outer membrane biogenesis lipoprotein LolB